MAGSTPSSEIQARRLLQQAGEWRLISLLLAPPSPGWRESLRQLAGCTEDPILRKAASAALQEGSEQSYHSVFAPRGPVSGREVGYRALLATGGLLAEINSYYEAFAYPAPGEEPPDHVCREADFVAYLRMKEAYALFCGHQEGAHLTAEAAQRFIEEHLAYIAEPLFTALEATGSEYLRLAAKSLLERTGPPRSPAPFRVLEQELTESLGEDGCPNL